MKLTYETNYILIHPEFSKLFIKAESLFATRTNALCFYLTLDAQVKAALIWRSSTTLIKAKKNSKISLNLHENVSFVAAAIPLQRYGILI